MSGYGKLLHVDLTADKLWSEPTETYREFIGGRGLNAALLFKLLKPGTDPIGPDNILIFSTGPVAGTLAPSSARYNVSARSPLTGYFGDSNSGGFWSASGAVAAPTRWPHSKRWRVIPCRHRRRSTGIRTARSSVRRCSSVRLSTVTRSWLQ